MSVTLDQVVAAMQAIAPLELAEDWDNVGLLAAPTRPRRISRALLTIDLTEPVLDEAIARKAELIIAYHPPIFDKLTRLTAGNKGRIITGAIENRIAIYSPHTALDAAPEGVNDFLARAFDARDVSPIQHHTTTPPTEELKVVVFVPHRSADKLCNALAQAGAGTIGHYTHCSFNTAGIGTFLGDDTTNPVVGSAGRLESADEIRMEMVAPRAALPVITHAIDQHHPYEQPAWEVYPLEPRPLRDTGIGRLVTLRKATSLDNITHQIKQHLGLDHVRLAAPTPRRSIKTIALCAGAGHSVLAPVAADLYLTGEMRHHDVLAANARGTAVVLTDHTHTERPYLPVLKKRLIQQLSRAIAIDIAKRDREPLVIV